MIFGSRSIRNCIIDNQWQHEEKTWFTKMAADGRWKNNVYTWKRTEWMHDAKDLYNCMYKNKNYKNGINIPAMKHRENWKHENELFHYMYVRWPNELHRTTQADLFKQLQYTRTCLHRICNGVSTQWYRTTNKAHDIE